MAIMVPEELDVIRTRLRVLIAEMELKLGRKIEDGEIAEMVGVSKQQFSNWKNDRGWPRMNQAYKLAKVLGCKVDDLYIYEEE